MRAELRAVMAAAVALLRQKADEMALAPAMLDSLRPASEPVPTTLPVLPQIPAMRDRAAPETQGTVDALIAAIPHLNWRQSYDRADGFDRRYLDSYGWVDLAGPHGPYRADGLRIMAGYWGAGLTYPDHSHPPEEHYLVLAGSTWLRLRDDPFRQIGPGGVFHVPAGVVHSAEMRGDGLLALSVWRAEDTSIQIDLTDSGRHVAQD